MFGNLPLKPNHIATTNILPAYQASLSFGLSEDALAQELGWSREALEDRDGSVSAESVYRHMEWALRRPHYEDFLMAAVAGHGPSSLGIVGLACKSLATVGAAMACHSRFQHLTNRTARYETAVEGQKLVVREYRESARLGSLLVSDYTMLIALQLLRSLTSVPLPVLALTSRREDVSEAQRRHVEAFAGVQLQTGGAHASLVLDASILSAPIVSVDTDMAEYFQSVLHQAPQFEDDEPALLRQVRLAIVDQLATGGAHIGPTAASLGLGQRTLQRRLKALDTGFAEVLDQTRRRLVQGHLKNESLSLAEIAYLVGFEEQTSFFRAFRRWHGQTPAEYRARLSAGMPATT